MTISLAVLGAGRIGQVHAAAISQVRGARLAAVSDPVASVAQKVADTYGCAIRSIDEIAAAKDVDGVVICTPTDTHADLIEKFVAADKAVFCEKPIDLSLDRVKACLKIVEKAGAKLMVGFNRRFDPDFCAVRAAIDADKVGSVEMVTITSRDPGPPPLDYIGRSGGIFRDMTIHDFDMARWLLGEEPESVVALASVLVDPAIGRAGDYDSVNVILRTAGGRQAVITNTRRATYGYDQRIEVLGSKGMVAAKNKREANIEIASADGFTRPPLLNFFMTRYTEAYVAEIAAFVAVVRDGMAPSPNGRDGLIALALAEAAIKSAREGRAVKVYELLSP